jgi:hypothetical protein
LANKSQEKTTRAQLAQEESATLVEARRVAYSDFTAEAWKYAIDLEFDGVGGITKREFEDKVLPRAKVMLEKWNKVLIVGTEPASAAGDKIFWTGAF